MTKQQDLKQALARSLYLVSTYVQPSKLSFSFSRSHPPNTFQ